MSFLNSNNFGYILILTSIIMLVFVSMAIYKNIKHKHYIYAFILLLPFSMAVASTGIVSASIRYSANNPIVNFLTLGTLKTFNNKDYLTFVTTNENYNIETDKFCKLDKSLINTPMQINFHKHGDKYLSFYDRNGKQIECNLIKYKKHYKNQ